MSEWQPIETASKDPDAKMLFLYPNGSVFCCGHWDTDRHANNPRPYWTCCWERVQGKTWLRSNQPTHWMPMPEPPKGE